MVIQVAVIGHHAPERSRIALVEQQLEFLLVAAHVGGAHLGAQLGGLPVEFRLAFRYGRFQLRAAFRAVSTLPLEFTESLAFLGNTHLRRLQLGGETIPIGGAVVHALFELADALPNLLEFALLDFRARPPALLGQGGRRKGKHQQQVKSRVDHGRTV